MTEPIPMADDERDESAAQDQRERMEMDERKDVYRAINSVQADLAVRGIGKDRRNEQQGYKFRGIDDVYNAVSSLMAKHGLCILPRCTERIVTERQTAKGGVLFYVVVRCEFDFVAASDGSRHVVVTYGEAMDSADKATNKAMSAAYKYALMQAFAIPTEGDNDADATTHEVAPLTDIERAALTKLREASLEGTEALSAAWQAVGKPIRLRLAGELESLKRAAATIKRGETADA